ncbi:FecR family protein [Pedobacter sp. WC2423]|uniref:FecR family protein n=1 Tax=Pedobacter sp. WC2423 TaxID=3234142 RepID=UPI00346774EF
MNKSELIKKYSNGTCTEGEKILLESWYNKFELNDIPRLTELQFEEINTSVPNIIANKRENKLWPQIAAVASIIISICIWFYFYKSVGTVRTEITFKNEIRPGKNGATLTLANGKNITLSNAINGILAKEAGVKITKSADGQIIYEVSNSSSKNGKGELHYNTLTTARGEQYQVRLPDSSIVWLNAASALKYPSSFASLKDRVVELSGEAYFQVAKDKKRPFIVYSRGQKVKVLGTHFNINGYDDEFSVQTTLLEGSIEVTSKKEINHLYQRGIAENKTVVIKPGQQSQIRKGQIKILSNVDLDDIVAWKDGYFIFNENIKSIMNKVARWYNVEIFYKNEPDPKLAFQGKIARSRSLSEVLGIMERTGAVNFKVEGRRVTITIN